MRAAVLSCLALVALSGCDPKPTTIVAKSTDDQQEALAKAKPVTLPPAIASSKSYRCEDNSLAYVDWFADGSAQIRTVKDGPSTKLPLPATSGEALKASDFSVLGTKDDAAVQIATPDHAKAQKCTA